jgi:hypothetical protein
MAKISARSQKVHQELTTSNTGQRTWLKTCLRENSFTFFVSIEMLVVVFAKKGGFALAVEFSQTFSVATNLSKSGSRLIKLTQLRF